MAAAAVLTLAQPSHPQALRLGDRVRVTQRGVAATGALTRLASDSVWLALPSRSAPLGLEIGPGFRLERSVGRRSRLAAGAAIGAAVGTAVTLGFLSGFCGGDNLCDGDEQLRAAALLGLPCVALGAGVGALIRVERWQQVPLRPAGLIIGIGLAWSPQ